MDKQKADRIITEYFQKIYGFAVKKAFSYDEAEDLCADILQEVYISLLRAGEIVNLEGYIWRISEHTYSKFVSSKRKQEGVSIDGLIIPFNEDFLKESEDDILRLRREVAFLTENRRRIVYLFYYENRSVSYIAQKLALPEGTVKWHLNKARNELKEGLSMERKIGRLGLSPITATGFSHGGNPGKNGGPEYYLGDKLNLNIVYSVYSEPKTKQGIAEELGVTPVYIEDKITLLEENGFLVPVKGNKYTTYVCFSPETYSLEMEENKYKMRIELVEILAKEYAPLVRKAISDIKDVYIPSGNRELLYATAVFKGVNRLAFVETNKNMSKYRIKTTDGGDYFAWVDIPSVQSDTDYKATVEMPLFWTCGDMTRWSEKYPAVYSWSVDSKLCSRKGAWKNNLTEDYEYLYEFMKGDISDNAANAEKFKRLREREFIGEDGKVNIMVLKGNCNDFFSKIPNPDEKIKERFVNRALELAMLEAKKYPPQMQDLIINSEVNSFAGSGLALMVMDILYQNGTFKPLTENEKVTSQLIMFSDILPE